MADSGNEVKEETNSTSLFLWIGISFAVLISYILVFKFYHRKRKETNTPNRFNFIENLKPEDTWQYEYDGNVVVRCEKIGGFRRTLRRFTPIPEFGMWHLRDLMLDLYGQKFGGEPKFQVPDDVVSISIPRNNFRCKGELSTEFEPKDGVIGEYTYEMLCSSVQVTWFHYENARYLAGIIVVMDNRYHPMKIIKANVKKAFQDLRIYKPNPQNFKEKLMRKVWCQFRNQWIIITQNEFGEIDKFVFNGQENQMELVKCTDCSLNSTVRLIENAPKPKKSSSKPLPTLDFSKFLKAEFCEKINDLVMIGKGSNGRICHFNWDSDLGKFKIQFCLECETTAKRRFEVPEGLEDEPPSYEFLELIELTQD